MGLTEMDLVRDSYTALAVPEADTDAQAAGESLVLRAQRMARTDSEPVSESFFEPVQEDEEGSFPVLADGYERRSPVQPYRTPLGFRRRRILKGIAAVAALAAAIIAAVWKSGLFSVG